MQISKDAQLPARTVAKLEANAGTYWDAFYQNNADKFFKERHWFEAEFPQLLSACIALEVGCGTGASALPLLELNPSARIYACDFSPTAVGLLQRHPAYLASPRITAFVADITVHDLRRWVPHASVDVATMVFVLSAVPPAAMPAALANVARTLRPGYGRVLFRDYAAGDLAQVRLQTEGRQRQLQEPNFYARGDGTLAYYFSEAFLLAVFARAGFRCEALQVVERVDENRKRGVRMERRFVQGAFVYLGPAAAEAAATAAAVEGQGDAGDAEAQSGAVQQHSGEEAQEVEVEAVLWQWTLRLRLPPPASAAGVQRSAGAFLARVLLRCPVLLRGAGVVELGAGAAGLPSLAALRWARRVAATDPDSATLCTLRYNVARNGHLVVVERLRVQALECGHAKQAQRVLGAFPGGADLVVAADPLSGCCDEEGRTAAMDGLLATALWLLAPRREGAALLVAEAAGGGGGWAAAAHRRGWEPAELPAEVDAAVQADERRGGMCLLAFSRP